jgi:hypothetical protein
MITARLAAAAAKVQGSDPEQVQATKTGDTDELVVGGVSVIDITDSDAQAAGLGSADDLAASWVKNVRGALGLSPSEPPSGQTATPAGQTATPAGPATQSIGK